MQTFSDKMEGHVRKEMTQQTKLILKILDENYPGEFSLNKDVKGNYHIYKGGKDITKDTEFIDNMKEIMGVEVTLFVRMYVCRQRFGIAKDVYLSIQQFLR